MTFSKQQAIREVILREGGYANDPNDNGGATKYGITEQVARSYGYLGDMKELPYDLAFSVYDNWYWSKASLDYIIVISPKLAEAVFDFNVNSGTVRSVKTLQTLINAMNYEEKLFVDLIVDGQLGGKTIEAIRAYLYKRNKDGLEVLISAFNGMRMSFLVGLAEGNTTQRRFTMGWLKRVHELGGN